MTDTSLMNKTMSLSEAITKAPNASGCYQLYCDGELVYVGKAQDGIRKRFVQYYNGTTAHYSSAIKILENRDNISVKWRVIEEPAAVVEQEAKWIRSLKPAWNCQSGWGDKGVLAGTGEAAAKTAASKAVPQASTVKATGSAGGIAAAAAESLGPELELAGLIGSSALNAVGGAVAATALVEAVKSVKEGDNMDDYVGNVVGKGAQSALAAGGGAVAGELAGLVAIGLGAGPVGWVATALGAGALASGVVAGATGDLAENIADAVSDGFFDLRMNCPLIDMPCTAVETVVDGIRDLFGWW